MQKCSGNLGFPPAGACCLDGSHQEAARLGISGHGSYEAIARACSTSCSSILLVKEFFDRCYWLWWNCMLGNNLRLQWVALLFHFITIQPQHSSHRSDWLRELRYRVRARDARRRVMRGEHQTPQSSKPSDYTNMSLIEDALAEIESLRSIDSICYTTVAEKHSVWRSTLTRRH
jgi:hypothetical protein